MKEKNLKINFHKKWQVLNVKKMINDKCKIIGLNI